MTEIPQPGQPESTPPAQPYPPQPAYQQPYPAQPAYQQPYPASDQAYPQQYPGQPTSLQYGAPVAPSTTNGLAISSLITGIVALLFAFIPFVGVISVLIGAVAVVLGVMAKRKVSEVGGGGMATAGIVVGALGALIAIIWLVLTIAVFNAADDNLDDISDQIQQQIDESDNG